MPNSKRIVWINGWGVSLSSLQGLVDERFPDVSNNCVHLAKDWKSAVSEAVDEADAICAYSTGTLCLLGQPDILERARRVYLFAPIFDFKSDAGLGGVARLGQLEYLRRWVRRNPSEALEDFRKRAGLVEACADSSDVPVDDLIWGLERLIEDSVNPPAADNVVGVIGGKDRLLDSSKIVEIWPRCHVAIEAGHSLTELLDAALISL